MSEIDGQTSWWSSTGFLGGYITSAITFKIIDVFQSKRLKSIEGLQWFDFISNEKLFQLSKQSKFSIQTSEQTLQWSSHLLRMPLHLPTQIIYDFHPIRACRNRPHCRLKKRWSDSMSEFFAIAKSDLAKQNWSPWTKVNEGSNRIPSIPRYTWQEIQVRSRKSNNWRCLKLQLQFWYSPSSPL